MLQRKWNIYTRILLLFIFFLFIFIFLRLSDQFKFSEKPKCVIKNFFLVDLGSGSIKGSYWQENSCLKQNHLKECRTDSVEYSFKRELTDSQNQLTENISKNLQKNLMFLLESLFKNANDCHTDADLKNPYQEMIIKIHGTAAYRSLSADHRKEFENEMKENIKKLSLSTMLSRSSELYNDRVEFQAIDQKEEAIKAYNSILFYFSREPRLFSRFQNKTLVVHDIGGGSSQLVMQKPTDALVKTKKNSGYHPENYVICGFHFASEGARENLLKQKKNFLSHTDGISQKKDLKRFNHPQVLNVVPFFTTPEHKKNHIQSIEEVMKKFATSFLSNIEKDLNQSKDCQELLKVLEDQPKDVYVVGVGGVYGFSVFFDGLKELERSHPDLVQEVQATQIIHKDYLILLNNYRFLANDLGKWGETSLGNPLLVLNYWNLFKIDQVLVIPKIDNTQGMLKEELDYWKEFEK